MIKTYRLLWQSYVMRIYLQVQMGNVTGFYQDLSYTMILLKVSPHYISGVNNICPRILMSDSYIKRLLSALRLKLYRC